jgi:TolB-like protein
MKRKWLSGFMLVVFFLEISCVSGGSPADETVLLDQAIRTAADRMLSDVKSGQTVAVLNFSSSSEQFSVYVLEELTDHLVNEKKFVIVDRRELDIIRREENFQMSGEVSDESAQAIGKKLGAQLVVSGSLTAIGKTYRFRTKVLNVESAVVESSSSLYIDAEESKVVFLLVNAQRTSTPRTEIKAEPASYYVSAKGYDSPYGGLSEDQPFKTLRYAVNRAAENDIKKITVIGTLDIKSEGTAENAGAVFNLRPMFASEEPGEILITGKTGASGIERAILSGNETKNNVLYISSGIFRFEHIEISGATGEWPSGVGLDISYTRTTASVSINPLGGSGSVKQVTPKITLGPGAAVRDNEEAGVGIGERMTCIISGGEVWDNKQNGVIVSGILLMQNGLISNNDSSGLFIGSKGAVTMTGGTISNNHFGGVYIMPGGKFDQTGGTIQNNRFANVYRRQEEKK